MRIAIIDFGSYAFVAQLARALAARGHAVLYVSFADYQGAKAGLGTRPDDPPNLTVVAVSLGEGFQRYNFVKRRQQEVRLGKKFADCVRAFRADVAVGANMPIDVHGTLMGSLARDNIRYVHWLQDIISLAVKEVLGSRMPAVASAVSTYYAWYEARLLRKSDALIAITADFLDALSGIKLDPARCHVLPNWAPLEDLPVLPKDNAWSREHGIVDKKVLLYSGSMGLKHNPKLLVEAAVALRSRPEAQIVVVAEGVGADYLVQGKREFGLDNLLMLPFQPAARLPDVLASGDVLTAFVEARASTFCVPSKLLTYFCAERAVLLAIPEENLAARIVTEKRLGPVVSPDDTKGYAEAAVRMLDDAAERQACAQRARHYAEEAFDIVRIADRFEAILGTVAARKKVA